VNETPIGDLVAALRRNGVPDFAWIVEWSQGGRDPVATAWAASDEALWMVALAMYLRADAGVDAALAAAGLTDPDDAEFAYAAAHWCTLDAAELHLSDAALCTAPWSVSKQARSKALAAARSTRRGERSNALYAACEAVSLACTALAAPRVVAAIRAAMPPPTLDQLLTRKPP
jgi:hypothetical protein